MEKKPFLVCYPVAWSVCSLIAAQLIEWFVEGVSRGIPYLHHRTPGGLPVHQIRLDLGDPWNLIVQNDRLLRDGQDLRERLLVLPPDAGSPCEDVWDRVVLLLALHVVH